MTSELVTIEIYKAFFLTGKRVPGLLWIYRTRNEDRGPGAQIWPLNPMADKDWEVSSDRKFMTSRLDNIFPMGVSAFTMMVARVQNIPLGAKHIKGNGGWTSALAWENTVWVVEKAHMKINGIAFKISLPTSFEGTCAPT